MMGSEHKSAILIMTDGATLVTMMEKLSGKEAKEVYKNGKKTDKIQFILGKEPDLQ